MLEKTSWFKGNTKRKQDNLESKFQYQPPTKRRRKERKGTTPVEEGGQGDVKAVMFVPYTVDSMLAKRMRDAEQTLQEMTGYRLKIVERSGTALEDILAKADPWQGQEYGREKCLLCLTKQRTGKQSTQDCTRRNIVYESWCMTCQEKDTRIAVEKAGGDKNKLKRLKDHPAYRNKHWILS